MNRFPGLGYIASYLLALPVIVVAVSSSGTVSIISALLAASWLALAPLALFSMRLRRVLPVIPAVFVGLVLAFLAFDSAAFAVDATASVVMFLGCLPRSRHARAHTSLLPTSPARA